jgi:PII-like signaling protein
MATQAVTIARIYLREGEHLLAKLLKFLHDEEKVSGVTVLRGIAGFGADGDMHLASLIDMSLDLPLIVEFYDRPERVEEVIDRHETRMGLSQVRVRSSPPPIFIDRSGCGLPSVRGGQLYDSI